MRRAPRFHDLPLFWKLLVPFVTVLVVVGTFGAFLIVRELSARARSDMNESLLQSSLEARGLFKDRELYLLESGNLASNLQGMTEAVSSDDVEQVDALLQSVLALKSDLALVVVTDDTGAPLSGTVAIPAPLPTSWWDADFVRDALTGSDRLKHAGLVELGNRQLLAIAAPICSIEERCDPTGVAVVALELQGLAERIADQVPADGGATLFDLDGEVLATAGLAPVQPPEARLDEGQVVRTTSTVDDRSIHSAFTPIVIQGEPQGMVAVARPSDEVFASVRGTGWRLALLLLVALGAIIAMGAWLSRQILRQVEPLVDTNRRLGTGDLTARAPVLAEDEIGEVARGLNQMAEQLQASHDNLELRVSQRTREVERLLRERTDFFASLSHELRTPLAVILSEADILLDLDHDEAPDTGRAIRESAAQLLAVVNDILDLAKADAGRLELDLRPTDLAEVVEELRPTIIGLARAGDIEADVVVPDHLPAVQADWLRLREIILNLVDNAVKYTPSGGTVAVRVVAGTDAVVVSVIDDGPGIPEDVGDRLFEPFYRVKGVAPQHGRDSSGLGLSLTRGLVVAHGGSIGYTSEPGAGTTFTFTLQYAQGRVQDGDSAPGSGRRQGEHLPC